MAWHWLSIDQAQIVLLQYVRVSKDTHVETIYEYMKEIWGLKKLPNIIISVTGGAEDFKMRSRLTKEFQKSLVKAAESTGIFVVVFEDFYLHSIKLSRLNAFENR